MEEPEKKKARLIKALDSMIYMPKLRKTRDALEVPGLALNQDHILEASDVDRKRREVPCIGRPWDRGELYARLQTFRSMTWFAKPELVNALECARRGWENTGIDELTCETCRTVLKYPCVESVACEPIAGKRFEENLSMSHDPLCPWRSAVCSLSLLEFPKHLSTMTIAADFKSRSAVLQKLLCIPPIAKESVDVLLQGTHSKNSLYVIKNGVQLDGSKQSKMQEFSDEVLSCVRESLQGSVAPYVERDTFIARVRILALCGWSMKILSLEESHEDDGVNHCLPEHAALICNLCGSKIGLWSFFEGYTPKPFSAASVVQKNGSVYKTGSSSLILNHQVAMNMTTTIAGGMLHQVDDLLVQDTDGPFGKPESNQAQPFGSPGGNITFRQENSATRKEIIPPGKAKAPQRRQMNAIAQYRAACTGAIDPLDSHRFFCPWANTPHKSQDEEIVQPGWQVYAENLASCPADILSATQEWQGKDVFKKVISSVGKFPNHS